MDSTYSTAYLNRGDLYSKYLNDNDSALLDYNKSIELDPEDSDNYYYRGRFYNDYLEDYDNAIEDFTKGIELNSSDPDLYFERGRTYGGLGNYIKSIADYLTVFKLDPGNKYTNNNNSMTMICLNFHNNHSKRAILF